MQIIVGWNEVLLVFFFFSLFGNLKTFYMEKLANSFFVFSFKC
jgi:hypothetical protein